MKALVVYESMRGNTEQIAPAVTEGIAERFDGACADVHWVPSANGVALLVVGGPTMHSG